MPHRYGPHDPSQAPDSVVVGRPGSYQGTEVVPIHPALVRQRKAINDHAHQVSAATHEGTPDDA